VAAFGAEQRSERWQTSIPGLARQGRDEQADEQFRIFILYQSIGIYTYSAKRASGECATAVIRFRESAEDELTELVVDSAQMKVDDSHWGRYQQ